jgi:cytosine/adenosine deaminase-related metal-dependent hydrolase
MTDFLIRGAKGILTGLEGEDARAAGDIRVRAGRIAALGDLAPEPGERVIDAASCVVLPGLVNTHHHLFQSVLKAVPAALNEGLASWLRLVPYTYWDRLDEDALRVSARIGLAELALSGATTVADHHYFYSDRYDFDPSAVLFDVADRFGIRFALCRGGATKARKFDTEAITPLPTETLEEMLSAIERDARRWHDPAPDAMRRVIVAPTTPTFSLEESELKDVAAFARGLGLRLHSHLSENLDYVAYTTGRYGKRPVHWLAEHNWLGEDVFFAHLVECDADEIALLAETGTGMAHCPQANARLGSGIAPADRLSRAGGQVSLAVDGAAANEAADMASALYAAFTLHRASKGWTAATAEDILGWATRGGARMLGLDAVGTIEVGKAADLALWDVTAPRWLGQHDPVVGPIISGGQASIRHSFVGGREIVRDGGLPWLDMEELADDAERVVRRLRETPSSARAA